MCGIQLLIDQSNNEQNKILFKKLFNNIKPRGPENTTLIQKTTQQYHLMIGFQRLKINDTTDSGNQPFVFENNQHFISVITNGEIYNHKSILQKKT